MNEKENNCENNNNNNISRKGNILSVLREEHLNLSDLAKKLNCSHTSILYHVKILEQDHLIFKNDNGCYQLHPFLFEPDNYNFIIDMLGFLVFKNKSIFRRDSNKYDNYEQHIHNLIKSILEIALFDFQELKL